MKKRLAIILMAVALLFVFTACDEDSPVGQLFGGEGNTENTAAAGGNTDDAGGVFKAKTKEEEVYYNGISGLKLTVAPGYYIEELDAVNMTSTPEESNDADELEWGEMTYGLYMDLFYIANKSTDLHDDHAVLSAYIEYMPDYTQEEYLEDTLSWLIAPSNGYESELTNEDVVTIDGKTAYYYEVTTQHESEGSVPYIEENYIIPLEEEGMYLTIYTNYWSDSSASKADAEKMFSTFISFL